PERSPYPILWTIRSYTFSAFCRLRLRGFFSLDPPDSVLDERGLLSTRFANWLTWSGDSHCAYRHPSDPRRASAATGENLTATVLSWNLDQVRTDLMGLFLSRGFSPWMGS
ncbi:MAG TPA: hypothetical protein VHT21_14350, partial [Stellaceae bacterium]|nr:hypothetical protein [Stellaceae bacterium]